MACGNNPAANEIGPAYEMFEVALDGDYPKKSDNLQEAFEKYRKKKQDELQKELLLSIKRKEPDHMAALRAKFLQTAKGYIGTPYAKRYHEPDSPTHNATLFLDCCGLIRQVLRDLKEDFGFTIGPWNQAYMFDTLPVAYTESHEMQPGDLVFISGVYNSPNAKRQRHDMVHVEIWFGEGEKTLGARWQKGRVEVHDSYKFQAKSYHSLQYHFRSIDTWLAGECKSYCPEHMWQTHKFNPGKKSIFAIEDNAEDEAVIEEEIEDEAAYSELVTESNEVSLSSSTCNTKQEVSKTKLGRSFVICGGNAGPLIERALTTKGWWRTQDKVSCTLLWTEIKRSIDYKSFREGEQMVNHFPNMKHLTTKIGLLESLRSYYRLYRPRIPMEKFFPMTFRMDLASERSKFIQTYEKHEQWICKPTGANQGKGIFLVKDLQQVLSCLERDQKCSKPTVSPIARIVQRYIADPLLINGRKFDLRVYMLVVWGGQWLVLFREGYVRLCCQQYEARSDDLSVHLTNQYQQKKNPLYSEVKEDTIWNFCQLQEYMSEHCGLADDWVATRLTERMMYIMTICFKSVKHKLSQTLGYFELLGFDFMLDAAFSVWLIEVNMNPALHTNCETLGRVSPGVVNETLDIAIEVFDKCRRNKPLYPVTSMNQFKKLILS